jgi:uncharacterized membrane protein
MTEAPRNLTLERGEKNVWEARRGVRAALNVDQEKWLLATLGSALATIGSRRRGFTGGLLATFGTILTVRAAMGYRDISAARDYIERAMQTRGYRQKDVVANASEDSFPASDSPSWTPTAGARTRA